MAEKVAVIWLTVEGSTPGPGAARHATGLEAGDGRLDRGDPGFEWRCQAGRTGLARRGQCWVKARGLDSDPSRRDKTTPARLERGPTRAGNGRHAGLNGRADVGDGHADLSGGPSSRPSAVRKLMETPRPARRLGPVGPTG